MKTKNFLLISNRYFWLTLALIFLQQFIVATSIVWITQFIFKLQSKEFSLLFLCLYFSSLILPYFPGALSLVLLAKSKVVAISKYALDFAKIYKGKVNEWGEDSNKNKKSTLLTAEAPQTISYILDYFYSLTASFLNVLLKIVTVALIIEPILFITFIIGLGLCLLILTYQKKLKKVLTLKAQQGRLKWIMMLMQAWDNVLLNNNYNFRIWTSKTDLRSKRFIGSAVKLEKFSQVISVLLAFCLILPTFVALLFVAFERREDFIWLSMMAVTLPRLFQVLTNSYELLFMVSDLTMQKHT
jgi:hypothetical protein